MRIERTDIHRPGAIVPGDYEFVSHDYIGPSQEYMNFAPERRILSAHKKNTGGHNAEHDHAGTCQVCGASALYVAFFYHAKTNTYVMVGEDCAFKLGMGDPMAFRNFRKAVADRRKAAKGMSKASKTLIDAGLSPAWDIYAAEDRSGFKYEENTISDIVGKLVRYGSVSDAQLGFIRKLLAQIPERAALEAKRAAENEAAAPVPISNNRITIEGVVLTVREPDEDAMYPSWKLLVRTDAGWKAWGSRPSSLCDVKRGDRVSFVARVTVSEKDPKFGFFSRPASARIVNTAVAA